jgi:hypothetical protein
MVRKNYIFWDIMPCSPLKVNQRFGGTCHFHFQSRRISQEKKSMKQAAVLSGFLLSLLFYLEDGSDCSGAVKIGHLAYEEASP